MTSGLIVFSRLDSRRLPGKALLDLGGRPLLGRCLDRCRMISGVPVVVATSDRPVDDDISRYCETEGVPCFRGSADNVAERAVRCAEHFSFDAFARICGDSPFFCDALVRELLDVQARTHCDVACNVFPRTYPVGASTEIVSTEAMRRLIEAPLDASDREHCTQYFYDHPDRFSIHNEVAPDPSWRSVRLAVDTPEDLRRSVRLINRLGGDPAKVSWDRLLDLSRELAD